MRHSIKLTEIYQDDEAQNHNINSEKHTVESFAPLKENRSVRLSLVYSGGNSQTTGKLQTDHLWLRQNSWIIYNKS